MGENISFFQMCQALPWLPQHFTSSVVFGHSPTITNNRGSEDTALFEKK